MSILTETYGHESEARRLTYKYSITGIETNDSRLLTDLENVMNDAFNIAEDKIEKELYKRGLMTCNANLESIDEMREYGNELVQAYIQNLDEKYKEH